MPDLRLRHRIYRHFADTTAAPSFDQVAEWTGDDESARTALRGLHDAHMVVLDDRGAADTIGMALPFSARPTEHVVISGSRRWYANCAWDALAIPAALAIDASIEATWLDAGGPVDLAVINAELTDTDGFVHFEVPARHWWDDIVET